VQVVNDLFKREFQRGKFEVWRREEEAVGLRVDLCA
jgi:hypothetical protein